MWNGVRVLTVDQSPLPFQPVRRIVDAAIHPLRVVPGRIGHAEHDPLAVLQGQQALGGVARVDRHVGAEAQRVELIDPRVVARLGAPRVGDASDLRQRLGIEGPALGTVLPGGGRAVERALALAAIEARKVPARQRRPDDAVAVDVHATRREAMDGRSRIVDRRLVHFRQRRLRRVRTRVQPDDRAGEAERRSPDRTIGRRRDGIEAAAEALVLRGIDRLIGLHVGVAPAVAVGVDDERGPSLRLRLVSGFLEHPGVEPADHLPAAARPQRVVRVLGEHQVMRAEAGADVRELLR